ncbi:MAG: hypothetical protein CXR30_05420 [Geobacter sp.]|nr:MAG: hypothetical protein CXR30_05420 [Geobacter sp.]
MHEKLVSLIVFPIVGVAVILVSGKFAWKAKQIRVIDDVRLISSKDTTGWMCFSHFINGILIFFLVLWSRVSEIGQPLMLLFAVLLIANVFLNFKFKYTMVAINNDKLLISGFFRKLAISVSEIESISQDFIKVTTPRIRIFFKHKTPFGESVIFIPVNEHVEHDLRSLMHEKKAE